MKSIRFTFKVIQKERENHRTSLRLSSSARIRDYDDIVTWKQFKKILKPHEYDQKEIDQLVGYLEDLTKTPEKL